MTRTYLAVVGAVLTTTLLALAAPAAAQIEPFAAPGVSAAVSAKVGWTWGDSTWEHDVHFFLRRAATLSALLGERGAFREDIARHLEATRR